MSLSGNGGGAGGGLSRRICTCAVYTFLLLFLFVWLLWHKGKWAHWVQLRARFVQGAKLFPMPPNCPVLQLLGELFGRKMGGSFFFGGGIVVREHKPLSGLC